MDWMWIVRDQDIMWFYVYLLCNSSTCVRYEQHTRLSLTPRAHKHTSTNTQAQTEKHTSSQARAQKLKQALIPISGWLFKVRLEKSLLASVVSFWHRSDITGVALRNIFSLLSFVHKHMFHRAWTKTSKEPLWEGRGCYIIVSQFVVLLSIWKVTRFPLSVTPLAHRQSQYTYIFLQLSCIKLNKSCWVAKATQIIFGAKAGVRTLPAGT